MKYSILLILSLITSTAFSKEQVSTQLNVSAKVFYQCHIPTEDKRILQQCEKQLPPKVETDGKYIIKTY